MLTALPRNVHPATVEGARIFSGNGLIYHCYKNRWGNSKIDMFLLDTVGDEQRLLRNVHLEWEFFSVHAITHSAAA